MNGVRAYYFDGKSTRRLEVNLAVLDDGELLIAGEGLSLKFPLAQIHGTTDIGSLRPAVYLPDGAKCEILDEVDVRELLRKPRSLAGFVHRLENKRRYIVPGLLVAVLAIWALIAFGIPALSRYAAFSLPPDATRLISDHTLESLDGSVLHPTKLSERRVAALRREFSDVMGRRVYPVQFRSGEAFGPNAFVLPSGVIIFTDALVKLADDDRELIAVLAHEIGHIEQRHTLRQLLQNSMTALFLSLMMGDITSASSLAVTMPVVLVQMKYSRQFETEADDYALAFLKQHGISPTYLLAILNRMATVHKEAADSTDFLSSHPATAKRIAHLRGLDK